MAIQSPASLMVLECACGTSACVDRHRLSAWEPSEKITLHSFIASAIKGPNLPIATVSFAQGIYQPYLAKEGIGHESHQSAS